jgi:ABC-type uncharacterized transport system ATPase component
MQTEKTNFKKKTILVTCFLVGALTIGGCDNSGTIINEESQKQKDSYDCNKIIQEFDKNQEQLVQAKANLEKAKATAQKAQLDFDALESQRP